MITTITQPDSGTILFNGEKLNSNHPGQIGYMPEERGLYKKMKVGDHLLYLAQLKGLSYVEALKQIKYWLERLEIKDWWNKKVEELSKGMQQKLQFVTTVVHQPKLLILDEPFSGLDPINANLLKDEIYKLHQQGTSIIFSTHRMEQVEEICDRIVLINKGKNILEGSVKDIKNQFKENLFQIDYAGTLPVNLKERTNITNENDHSIQVKLPTDKDSSSLLRYLLDNEVQIKSFNEILPSINEIFIRQVGESN